MHVTQWRHRAARVTTSGSRFRKACGATRVSRNTIRKNFRVEGY